nr:hypothetical protein [Tanacetum cinerariifolium]
MVDSIEASPIRIETTEEGTKILATVDGILKTVTESSLRRNIKLKDEEGIIADEPASPLRDVSQGEACPTDSGFIPDQDRAISPPPCPMIKHQSLQRQYSELAIKFKAQKIEITKLKAKVKLLEDREGGAAEGSGDDAPIKGRNLDEGGSILASGAAEAPTGSGSIPTAGPPATEVPTGSDVVPTASPVFATATVVTPYRRRKGKEVMIARDAEIARIHAEEELQIMIDGFDRNNETEYHQFASELPIERRIELISDLVKYQDNYAKIYKFQGQQRKPWTKKGMTFEEVKAKFNSVWKQIEDFIPMGSKEEAERIKRKGLSLEQESEKKFKPSEEVTEEAKSPDEVPEEKIKEMMQLVSIEEVEDLPIMKISEGDSQQQTTYQ